MSETKERLESVLCNRELERFWDEALLGWRDATTSQRSDARNFILRMRDDLVGVLQSVDDPAERETVWMLCFLLLKSRWNLLNMRIGYEMAAGTMNEELFCRATLLSCTGEAMEPFIDPQDIERALIFVEQPVFVQRVISFLGRVVEPERALETILNNDALERTWDECLSSWHDASVDQQAACRNFIVRLRDDLVNVVYRITDPKEHPIIWANTYIHLKSSWILLNTRIGYEMAIDTKDGSLFVKAALLSTLLEALEVNIRPEDVERIDLFLNHPYMSGDLAEDVHLVESSERRAEAERAEELSLALVRGHADSEVRIRHLNNTISAMKSKLHRLEADRETLFAEIGESEPQAVVALVRGMQKELLDAQRSFGGSHEEQTLMDAGLGSEEMLTKITNLSDLLRKQRQELTDLRTFRDTLALETGKGDAAAIVDYVRDQNDSLTAMQDRLITAFASQDAFRQTFGEIEPAQIAQMTHEMNLRIASLEEQLSPLQIGHDLFVREFGKFDVVEVIERIRSLAQKVAAAETQHAAIVSGGEALQRELGSRDPAEIITLVRNLHDTLARLQNEREQMRQHSELLEREMGTADAQAIIARFQELNEQVTSYGSVAELLGSMDDVMKAFN